MAHVLFLVTEDYAFCSHRLSLARAVRDAGHKVSVACRVAAHGDRIRAEGFDLHPLPLRRASLNILGDVSLLGRLIGLYRRLRPDIVHHVALKPVLYGSIAARLAGVPAVVNAFTGMGYVFTGHSAKHRAIRSLLVPGLRTALAAPSMSVVVQNETDGALLRDLGITRPDRLHLIPGSGIDTQLFRPSPEPEEPPVASLVARLLWDKGVGETVEAARLLRQRGVALRIALIGAPDPANPRSVDPATLEVWRNEGLVELWGPRNDIDQVWRESHIALLPSYREGMPRALLEAAAAGRPMVTTDVPGCRDLVRDGIDGLVVPAKNPEALADALAKLTADSGLRRRMGEAARQHVLERFSDACINRAFLDLYGRLL